MIVAAGMYLCYFWGFIFMARMAGDRLWAGIIVVIMVVLGLGFYFHLRGKTSAGDARRAAIGHVAVAFAMILLILNLRLDVWLAAYRGVSLTEIHQLLPSWVMPVLTLGLLAWAGTVCALTRPKRPA